MSDSKKKTNAFFKKFLSMKLWVTIWAMVLVSYVIFTKQNEMISLVMPLSFAPLAYCGLNVWQKKILNKETGE